MTDKERMKQRFAPLASGGRAIQIITTGLYSAAETKNQQGLKLEMTITFADTTVSACYNCISYFCVVKDNLS